MRLKPGQELTDSESVGQGRAVYRVGKPLCESPFYAFYDARRLYWNVDRKTGGRGKLCEEDDALQVVLKTFLYSRPNDRDLVKSTRDAIDLEVRFLKTRTTNLLPEPLDELRVSNDQDDFANSSGKFKRSEPVLVFKRVHGRRLTDVIAADFPSGLPFERAEPLLLELVQFLEALRRTNKEKRTVWSCCNLSPDQILVDRSFAIHVTGTGSVWPIRSGVIDYPPQELRRSSPGYCAPEVVAGKEADGRADLHAWGAVAAFTLTGVRPVVRPDGSTSLDAVALERLARPEIPPWVGGIVERCIARDLGERPGDPETLERWWHSPPPARPRWALGLYNRPRQAMTVLVGSTTPRVEVMAGTAVLARGRASAQVPIELTGLASPTGIEVRSLALDAEDDKAGRSSSRTVVAVDLEDEDAIRRVATELASSGGDAVGSLVQYGGSAARRALSRAADPTVRFAAIVAGVNARDVQGVLQAIKQEPSSDVRFSAAARAYVAFGKEVGSDLESIVIPQEPWPAVDAALKSLEQLSVDKAVGSPGTELEFAL